MDPTGVIKEADPPAAAPPMFILGAGSSQPSDNSNSNSGDPPPIQFKAQFTLPGGTVSAISGPAAGVGPSAGQISFTATPQPPPALASTGAPVISIQGGDTKTTLNNFTITAPPMQPPQQQQLPAVSDLLQHLSDYNPTIPDTVTAHYLSTAGFDTGDPRLLRLVSLAAQKFVSDVAQDALTQCKMRQGMSDVNTGTTPKRTAKDKRFVMTVEDVSAALGEQGITVKRPPFYQ